MLNKFSEAIRGNLTKNQRLKIVSLVTIEVHARDILEKLIKGKVADHSAFDWLSQLRVYWDRVGVTLHLLVLMQNKGDNFNSIKVSLS